MPDDDNPNDQSPAVNPKAPKRPPPTAPAVKTENVSSGANSITVSDSTSAVQPKSPTRHSGLLNGHDRHTPAEQRRTNDEAGKDATLPADAGSVSSGQHRDAGEPDSSARPKSTFEEVKELFLQKAREEMAANDAKIANLKNSIAGFTRKNQEIQRQIQSFERKRAARKRKQSEAPTNKLLTSEPGTVDPPFDPIQQPSTKRRYGEQEPVTETAESLVADPRPDTANMVSECFQLSKCEMISSSSEHQTLTFVDIVHESAKATLNRIKDASQYTKCQCQQKCDDACLNRESMVICDDNTCRLSETECGNRWLKRLKDSKPLVSVVMTEGCGHGLIATDFLPKGDMISPYYGEIIDNAEQQHRNWVFCEEACRATEAWRAEESTVVVSLSLHIMVERA